MGTRFIVGGNTSTFTIGDNTTKLEVGATLSNLQDARDVNLTSVADNEILVYDGTESEWINSKDLNTTGTIITGDHTGTEAEVVNVIYGTGDPPSAGSVTEGTLFVQYIE